MNTSTSKVGENAHKITKLIILTKGFSRAWSTTKKLKFTMEEVARKNDN
jgi:hypothetical protein